MKLFGHVCAWALILFGAAVFALGLLELLTEPGSTAYSAAPTSDELTAASISKLSRAFSIVGEGFTWIALGVALGLLAQIADCIDFMADKD